MRPSLLIPVSLLVLAGVPFLGCTGADAADEAVTVHEFVPVRLSLPPVPAAPPRLQVVAWDLRGSARGEPGKCAVRLRDTVNGVDWHIQAAQAWDTTVVRGDTTFVRHTVIGDFLPARREVYGMAPDAVARVDCGSYAILGLEDAGR